MSGEAQLVVRSGIAPIDDRLGGLVRGRAHLLTGTTGSGKTALCLTFVGAALSEGESAAILTQDDPQDLIAQAADLGIDLRRAAATGRFAMLRYQRDFVPRLGRTLSPALALDELARLMGPGMPSRFAVDSITPFLDGDTAAGGGVAAFTEFLERSRATTLVTYRGDLRDHYDRRLDPLMRHCAAVLYLSAYGQGIGRMDVVKVRRPLSSDATTFFAIRRGRGVVALADGADEPAGAEPFRRQILLFEGDDGLPDDFFSALESAYAVAMQGRPGSVVPGALPFDVGAVLVVARWDTLADAGLFLQHLRHFGIRTPVILVTRGDMRSADRARALLSGFDDVVTDTVGPEEFTARVTAVVRRGRSATVPAVVPDGAQKGARSDGHVDNGAVVVDEGRFRRTIEIAANGNSGDVFSVLLLDPEAGELEALASVVARTMRSASGDVAGVVGDRVAVYMPGTRRADVTPLLRRVTEAWRRGGHGEFRVVQLVYPADSERLRADLRLSASSVHVPMTE
jgi:KaiC/GvpD/RAD55 family RecA-like ATPase/CheY-like chemotaxis protein